MTYRMTYNLINSLMLAFLLLSLIHSASANTHLPDDIQWLTNDQAVEWGSTSAQKGGTLRFSIPSFPLTLRTVGPDANSFFRDYLLDNQMPLVAMHPNTGEIIPMLASHWAYGSDGKTVYYKIKKTARWSDGPLVTADDFLFALDFNRSEVISSPWHNHHFSEEITDVIKFDAHTIAIVGAKIKPKADLHYFYDLRPRAKHFHKLDMRWLDDFDWKIEPNTGAYQIYNIQKGKLIAFKRKKNWWAQEDRYLRNRFNVSKVLIKVVRNPNIAYKYFEQAELDIFNLTLPNLWHHKANGSLYEKGFIHKLSFYNQKERDASGFFLNLNNSNLRNINIRKAIAHSLDFNKINQLSLHNDYRRLTSFHSGYGEYSNTQITPLAFDLKKAVKYLDATNWKGTDSLGIRMRGKERLSFTVVYGNKLHEAHINYLTNEVKKAGIELIPQFLESMIFYKTIMDKTYDIAWLGFNADLRPNYWQFFHSDNANKLNTNNITNLADRHIDQLIDQYQNAATTAESIRLAHQLESEIAAKVIFIPSSSAPFTRTGFWRWLNLPESVATKSSASIFDPFHPTQGGLFWIDGVKKLNTLSAKRNDSGFKPNTIINRDYQ